MDRPPIRILLIEDDEDDYILVTDFLSEIVSSRYALTWESSYEAALRALNRLEYDVCLLDYRLGERTGLELMEEVMKNNPATPIIFLTAQGDYDVDLEAMKSGATDYLVKDRINASLLERSIRYAIEHKRTEETLRESEKQLKHLSSLLLTAQETERKRIAKELHDGASQFISAAKFGVENALQHLQQGTQAEGIKTLKAVIPMLREGIEEIRRISTDLWPSILNDLGILATINWFCRKFENIYSGIRIEKEIDVAEEEIPESLKIILYRIMQEATNNIAKHSQADLVALLLKKKAEQIELIIQDNGRGFVLKPRPLREGSPKGLGLSSMKERAEFSGGVFTIESAIGKGTVIKATWPLK